MRRSRTAIRPYLLSHMKPSPHASSATPLTSPPFEAPGPGPWEAETAHFPRPITRFAAEPFVRAFPVGFAEGTARYGLLLSHFKGALVNGFFYQQPVAYGAPEGAAGPPPKAVLWLLTRLHPKLRARIEVCRQAFANKLWRKDLETWDTIERPRAVREHSRLQAIDPGGLSDTELSQHLEVLHTHMEAMICLHHRYTITCVIATGDYLAHVTSWTGASAGEALQLLAGTSPISKGVAAAELTTLASSIQASPDAARVLAGSDPARVLAELCALPDPIGKQARAYLDIVRYRSVGYDLCDKACGEMPELLVRAIRASLDGGSSERALAQRAEKEHALRARVPAQHQAEFDALLGEARAINRLRDERGVYSDGWGTGLARRGVLEAGRRLLERGLLADAEHAVDVSLTELQALLAGGTSPTRTEVEERVRWRKTKTVADIPAWLNAPPAGPPSAEILPAAARRAARAVDAVLSNLFKEAPTESTAQIVRGLSVNNGVYEGRARLVLDAADFSKIERGDVLVTRATSPYFNVVLPLLGALVTDRGGQLCHAAIVAREYGIPGIVGTKVATQTIADGARVRVDGSTGEVRVLAAPS
jgi:phosphohistidine swiveling domain-containing protein